MPLQQEKYHTFTFGIGNKGTNIRPATDFKNILSFLEVLSERFFIIPHPIQALQEK